MLLSGWDASPLDGQHCFEGNFLIIYLSDYPMYPDYALYHVNPLVLFFFYDGIIKLINNTKIYCSCDVVIIPQNFWNMQEMQEFDF